MNDREIIEAAMKGIEEPIQQQDNRPWWKRLVSSFRGTFKAGDSWKEPVKEVTAKGGFDF